MLTNVTRALTSDAPFGLHREDRKDGVSVLRSLSSFCRVTILRRHFAVQLRLAVRRFSTATTRVAARSLSLAKLPSDWTPFAARLGRHTRSCEKLRFSLRTLCPTLRPTAEENS